METSSLTVRSQTVHLPSPWSNRAVLTIPLVAKSRDFGRLFGTGAYRRRFYLLKPKVRKAPVWTRGQKSVYSPDFLQTRHRKETSAGSENRDVPQPQLWDELSCSVWLHPESPRQSNSSRKREETGFLRQDWTWPQLVAKRGHAHGRLLRRRRRWPRRTAARAPSAPQRRLRAHRLPPSLRRPRRAHGSPTRWA